MIEEKIRYLGTCYTDFSTLSEIKKNQKGKILVKVYLQQGRELSF